MVHPGRTESVSSRKTAADEYAATLRRAKLKDLFISKRIYMGLPARSRREKIKQWEVRDIAL